MKARNGIILAAALALSGTAFAHGLDRHAGYDRYDRTGYVGTNALHTGGMTYEDQALADRIASAIASDKELSKPGITATIVANNGRVSINGEANDHQQAQRAEQIACDIAGRANVTGTLDVS